MKKIENLESTLKASATIDPVVEEALKNQTRTDQIKTNVRRQTTQHHLGNLFSQTVSGQVATQLSETLKAFFPCLKKDDKQ